jgi:hypothetical protein
VWCRDAQRVHVTVVGKNRASRRTLTGSPRLGYGAAMNGRAPAATLSIWCSVAVGCGLLGETETHETVRGRLKFVRTQTATGRYGDEKSYTISDGDLRFSGKRLWGLGTYVTCDPSPNEAREAFVCSRHADMHELVDVVSVVSGRPEAVNIHDRDLRQGSGSPTWAGDREGRWLIVEDLLYDVETGEKRPIKGAPGRYDDADFRAVSPDAETVVYQLDCMGGMAESETAKRIAALCSEADARKLDVLWLVDVRTGAVEVRKLRHADHDWLEDRGRFPGGAEWLASFRRRLAWEPDPKGTLRLVAPPADEP